MPAEPLDHALSQFEKGLDEIACNLERLDRAAAATEVSPLALPPQESMAEEKLREFAGRLYAAAHGHLFQESGTVEEIMIRILREVERLVRAGGK